MRGFKFALALILLLAACQTQAAGIRRIKIDASPAGPEIAGVVWYPCATLAQDVRSDDISLSGMKGCPLVGDKLPLIVMSHGRRGWFGGHHDTAAALADAGFVVAAISHPQDNGPDHSGTDSLEVLAGRSGDIKRLVDFMLGAWTLAPYVGLYGDYYFTRDSAGALAAAAAAIPTNLVLDGWSARATGGLTAKSSSGAQIAIGAERAGIGGSFGFWTYRARGSVPFGAQ